MGARKPHVVLLPYPAQGHVRPMMQLAKLLHWRGFHITVVNTEHNQSRLRRFVDDLPDLRFEAIPDGLPLSDKDTTQDVPALCHATRTHCLAPFKDLIRLNSSAIPVTCMVSVGVMSFGIKAARDLGIPQVQFWTASACSFMGFLHYHHLLQRGIVPFPDDKYLHDGTLETPVDWIPGLTNVRLKDLPSFMRIKSADDLMFDFMGSEARNCLESSAIIFNTFDELEEGVLGVMSAEFPNIYTIGPLPLLGRHVPDSEYKRLSLSLWKEDSACLDWLDTKEPNSVVYVNYGSMTTMTEQQLVEIVWGLAESGKLFLWVVRADVVEGSDSAELPPEFPAEVSNRALLARWCPQGKVLDHPAVAVFLTHCGWNSTIEALGAGRPIICWPFFADQQTNCRYACVNWGTGAELDGDVNRHRVSALVNDRMDGQRTRDTALTWKSKAVEATHVGGFL